MTEEIWKPVVGYEGLYEVSSLGRARSLGRFVSINRFLKGRILRLCYNAKGYLRAQLSSNNKAKMYMVHRLVAIAFLPNPDNLPEVNHIDEDKTNNSVENLEWCDGKYNVNYGTRNDRIRDTRLKNGTYTGLSKEEYKKRYWKNYYQKNKDKKRECCKKWSQENKGKKREYWKIWHQKHKNEYNEYQREYRRKKKAGL